VILKRPVRLHYERKRSIRIKSTRGTGLSLGREIGAGSSVSASLSERARCSLLRLLTSSDAAFNSRETCAELAASEGERAGLFCGEAVGEVFVEEEGVTGGERREEAGRESAAAGVAGVAGPIVAAGTGVGVAVAVRAGVALT